MTKARILIVEDEAIVARDIRQQLTELGYEPAADTARGEEALVLAEQLRPDLVLMDIHLAGKMDGIAAAKAIRDRFALPVVFLTAFADDETLDRAKVAEPFGYIIKPFEGRELRTVIEMALYKHTTETRLRESHEVQTAILRTALDGFWLVDMEGRILEVNDACCAQHGSSREEIVGKFVGDFEMEDSPEKIAAISEHIRQAGSFRFEGRHRVKNGPPIDLELNINYLPHSGGRCFAFMRDITERKRVQQEREITVRLLELVNGHNNLHELIQAVTLLLRDWSGCEAVGVRLKAGEDFPYFETRGFPAQFVRAESRLCRLDATGLVVRNLAGHPELDCMCGNVVCGRFDPAKPFFTGHGTFWTNSTTDLLASTTETDRQARTRNRCHGEGYESVALVPLRVGGDTLGLLQLNDKRRDRFTPEQIMFFERLADSLAIAIALRQSHEETQRSEIKFRTYIEHAPLGVFVIDRSGRYLEVNKAGAAMMGYSEAELLQMRVTDVHAADARETGAQRIARLFDQGAINSEAHLRRKDGSVFWASIVAAKLDDQRFIGFNQDITARKAAEDGMRRHRDMLARTESVANVGTWEWDIATGAVTWSEEMFRIFQLKPFDGAPSFENQSALYHPADMERLKAAAEIAVAEGRPYELEMRANRADGETRFCIARGHAEMAPNGKVTRLFGFLQDITERKRTEQEISTILQTTIDGYYLVDLEGRILDANNAYCSLVGYSRAELQQIGVKGVEAVDTDELIKRRLQTILKTGSDRFETKHICKDGRVISIEASVTFITQKEPKLVCFMRDITERKQAQAALQEGEEKLRELVNTLSEGVALNEVVYDDRGQMIDYRILEVNKAFHSVADFLPQQVIGNLATKVYGMSSDSIRAFWDSHKGRTEAVQTEMVSPLHQRCFLISTSPIVKDRFITSFFDITARKEAEAALRASERDLKEAQALSHIGSWQVEFGEEGERWSGSAELYRIYGYPEGAPLDRRTGFDRMHPEDRDATARIWAAVMRGEGPDEWEHRLVVDGETKWIQVRARAHFDATGRLLAATGTNQDITVRKRAELEQKEALAEARRFRDALDQVSAYIYIKDSQSRYIYANRPTLTLFGCSAEELIGRDDARFFPPDTIKRLREVDARVFLGEHTQEEIDVAHPDIGRRTYLETKTPIYADSDRSRVVGLLGVSTDITELKLTEDALRHRKDALKKAQQVAHVGSWEWSIPDNRLEWSEEMFRIFGVEPEGFSGDLAEVIAKAVHPEDRAAVDRANLAVIHQQQPEPLEYRVVWPNGTVRVVWAEAGELILDAASNPLRLSGIVQDITERKGAEVELKASEDRFRTLIERAPIAIGISRSATTIYANKKYLELFGFDRVEEVSGRPLTDQFSEAFREVVANRTHQRELGLPVPDEYEGVGRRKDGSLFPMHVAAAQVVLADGVASIGFLTDITDRKRAETALRDEQERLRTILDTVGAPIFVKDNDHRIVVANRAFHDILHVDENAEIGIFQTDLVSADEQRRFLEVDRQVLETGMPDLREETLTAKGYATRNIVTKKTRFIDQSGKRFLVGAIHDVTERKQAEARLQSSQAELAAIYDHAPIIMCLLDEDRNIVHANRAAAELAKREPVALLGLRGGDLIGCANALDDPRGCGFGAGCSSCMLRQAIQDTLLSGRSHLGVAAQIFAVGGSQRQEFHVIAHTAQLQVAGRKRVLLCLEDVTPRRQAEAARKQAEEQFRQAQKMDAVGQLAGGVAHDFNNILAAVLMYIGLLQEEPSIEPNFRTALKELAKEVQRGAGLTRQLLAFSRQQAMEPKVLDVFEIVSGLLKMLRRLLGEHITLLLDGGKALPPVEADSGMLEQVVINLCVNARDAMPRGGQLTLRADAIDVGAEALAANADARVGRFLRLSFTDTGCGMDQATLRRIFEPFFTTKEVGKGTGLGLATVYGIVKQHRGWIEVESTVGQGSTFRIYLPACEASATVATEREQPQKSTGRNEVVFVVEDEAAVRAAVSRTLRGNGYRTIEAANGPEALRLWGERSAEIDLLLTDMVMPEGMTGRELAERFRNDKPGLKVIIFTGYSHEMVTHPIDESQRITILRKPSDAVELVRTVRQCLDGV